MGQQLPELPPLNPVGLDLQQYATYVRKMTAGGVQDFNMPLSTLVSQGLVLRARDKVLMRTIDPRAEEIICFCLGGVFPNDNQGGIYFTVLSNDPDNDGDRIRPNAYRGFVWYKWLI